MLENKKYVRKFSKILMIFITIMMVLGIYIKTAHATIDSGNGTINPIYKPKWEIVGSSIDTNAKTLTINVKGTAYESDTIDGVNIDYASDVSSTLQPSDITVYIDGEEVTTATNPRVVVNTGTQSTNGETNKKDITHSIILSNFEVAVRETTGRDYKEWSGNLEIKIAGRGKNSGTYDENVLTDKYGSSVDGSGNVTIGLNGNQYMMETDQNGTNADGSWITLKLSDEHDEINSNTNGIMFADFVKPEFTYRQSTGTIVNNTNETVTVKFDVIDKYFKQTKLTAEDITVLVDDYDATEINDWIDKKLTKTATLVLNKTNGTVSTKAANYTVTNENVERIVGESYELLISKLDKEDRTSGVGDGFKFSGHMSLAFAAGSKAANGTLISGIMDNSGNLNDATTIAIGLDETDGNPNPDTIHGSGSIIDVVDPVWKIENINLIENKIDLTNSTLTFDLIATDKHYLSNTLKSNIAKNMLIYVGDVLDGDTNGNNIFDDGEVLTPFITKVVSEPTNLAEPGTGVKFKITLSHWDVEKHSGTTVLVIPAGTITDQYTNTSNQQEFRLGHVDFIKPVITKISSDLIDTNSDGIKDSVEVVFKATDKYLVMDDLVTIPNPEDPDAKDEITVYIDDEPVTGITRTLTSEEITETVDGVTVKGHKYRLVLSNLEQARTSINRNREFSDWSGTVRVDIAEGAVVDETITIAGKTAGGNKNDLTPITGVFVDFVKPDITYEYSVTDIVRNHENKELRTFTMVFDITDKYFKESAFANALSSATTDNEKLAVLKQYMTIWMDGVNITNVNTITKKIVAVENVTATMNKTTDIDSKKIESVTNALIGKRFTLEMSGFEQDIETALGEKYLNYSGVVTVAIKTGAAIDQGQDGKGTTSNTNIAGSISVPSITSGVNTPGGSGAGTVVDLVDPLWSQADNVEARPYENYAKIPVKITDKYIQKDASNEVFMRKESGNKIYDLQPSDIEIIVTTPSGTVTVNGANAEDKDMILTIKEDTSVNLDYGKQYIIELNGYSAEAYQVKIILRDGITADQSGNTSHKKEFVLFSSLVGTSSETEKESKFLSKNVPTREDIPQRQYIEQVIFQNNLEGINDNNKWDVSQLNDGTIWAWYKTRTADDGTTLYTVYIGSYIIINGNVNSNYLFAHLGYDENCKVTGDRIGNEFIKNIYILQTASIKNMTHMFWRCGYSNMKSLDLGTSFNTVSTTTMQYMFVECGYKSMESLKLGDNFNTSNVIDMSHMFSGCGNQRLENLDLRPSASATEEQKATMFDTSNVKNMEYMFNRCGYGTTEDDGTVTGLTNLYLGENFNTEKVENMSYMFANAGLNKLTSLDLGDKFYTTNVTNMESMFFQCGYNLMTSIDLGDYFNTANVTDMESMFHGCGYKNLVSLDLGDLFYTTSVTNMTNMFKLCGTNKMVTLDLGPAFTKIADTNTDFIANAGKSGCIIYAPESIYNDMKNFKLNTSSTNQIQYDKGIINPIYKPEWSKQSSSIDDSTGRMTIIVNGMANKIQTAGTPIVNYLSEVEASVIPSQITVYVDGEKADSIERNVQLNTRETDVRDGNLTYKRNGDIYYKDAENVTHLVGKQYKVILSNFEEEFRQNTKSFKEWSGNVELQFAKGTLKDKYGNLNLAEAELTTQGRMEPILVEETSKISANILPPNDAKMFGDFIKPEFTYKSSTTIIGDGNHGDTKTVKVIFDVTDNYFNSTNLETDTNASKITVKVDQDDEVNSKIKKALSKTATLVMNKETKAVTVKAANYTINTATELKVGERYELVISNIQQNPNNAFDYSGVVTLGFDTGIIQDLSGNVNDSTTIAIGLDENDGNPNEEDDVINGGTTVDVVDPIWKVENITTTTTTLGGQPVTSSSMDLIAIDKFFKQTTLQKEDIQVFISDVNINQTGGAELQRELSSPIYIKWDHETGTYTTDGVTRENANGQKFKFTISNFEKACEEPYEQFMEVRANGTRVYREFTGPVKILIPADTIEDNSGNKNLELEVDIRHIDTLKPEIVKVSSQSNINASNVELSTHTIIFDIVDKYLDTSSITKNGNTSMIHVYIDGELTEIDTNGDGVLDTDTVTKTITNVEQLNATVNGITQKVGYRYTLVLSNFQNERKGIDYTREYTDWSGDLTIKIDKNVAYDVNPTDSTDRRGNAETILAGNEGNTTNADYADFVDYIKPDATYKYSETDVDYDEEDGKTFTMVFDITDKFYDTDEGNVLSVEDLQVLISAENEIGEGKERYKDITSHARIKNVQNVTNTVNGETKTIGKRYTLVISNLEQVQKIEGSNYLDYSGAITVLIPANKVKDEAGNGNDKTSITSGVDIPGGNVTDTESIDVVAPIWERTEITTDLHNKTATMKIRGTDKYFFNKDKDGNLASASDDGYGTLTSDEIELYVDGTKTTGNITISGENRLFEERIVLPEYGDGSVSASPTTEMVQYGIEYTITITNYNTDKKQVKIRLKEGSLIDKSNNKSKPTEFLVYGTLKSTASETEKTSKFLGEVVPTGRTAIARQDIEQVVFVNNIEGSKAAGVQNVWDVSAQGDNSILAWYSETEAPYTVYIGSEDEIYGNINSSYLFSYIGKSEICTKTETILNLNLLHTENVTDMSYMFNRLGYNAMTKLIIPSTFDTSKVTNMKGMFLGCGFYSLESLTLPEKFNTSKVTNMNQMFAMCGTKLMSSLTLSTTFDTTNVTKMNQMFDDCGSNKLQILNLGSKFNTINVTTMYAMFRNCGSYSLKTLNLGENFNTTNVTNMKEMFEGTARYSTSFTILDLGENFDTSNVENMNYMFERTGDTAMTTLKLGDKFNTSKVKEMYRMFRGCGAFTSLDLGEQFYTTSVTNMGRMFDGCGEGTMATLDLGPAFTQIPQGNVSVVDNTSNTITVDANADFINNTGKSGCIIYAPESIYSDMKHFKLNTDSSIKIEYTQGTINPKYKPEWTKFSSSLKIEQADKLEDSTMTIIVDAKVDKTIYADSIKTLTYVLTQGNDASNLINIFVDGEKASNITKTVTINTRETDSKVGDITYKTNGDIYTKINGTQQLIGKQYKIVLSDFEESVRQSGKNFKEWSGNIALSFAKGSLIDNYGNKNMTEIDIDVNDLSKKEPIKIVGDTELNANVVSDKMFADYIKPEFTYEYSDTIIGSGPTGDKKVKIVFDVTDKYFESTSLKVDQYAELITVVIESKTLVGDIDKDGIIDTGEDIRKTLTQTGIFVMNKATKQITAQAVDYTIPSTEKKVGERYELLIEGLEGIDGVGYSGPMTFSFPAGIIEDNSGNKNDLMSITIGVDEPENHPGHNSPVIVDLVNPLWTGPHDVNTINRTEDTVSVTIIGSDKYYASNSLTTGKIAVYVDDVLDTGTISKSLTQITNGVQLATLASNAGLPNDVELVGYVLTLGNFGDQPADISGITKIVIEAGTITDDSGNQNKATTIYVGNEDWLESGDVEPPRYPAFRNDIVDFIDPVINYTYSAVEGSENPNVNYEEKKVTLKFTVEDKYFLESDLMKPATDATGNSIYIPKNISVVVDGTKVYDGNLETQPYQVTTTISVTDIKGTVNGVANSVIGKEYTLIISNIEQSPNNGFNFSGPMQVIFEPGVIEDKSGNVNSATTITLDTEIESDIVDVVDPFIYYDTEVISSIDRTNNTVTLNIRVDDKYLKSLSTEEVIVLEQNLENNITVRIQDENGNDIIKDKTTIQKDVTRTGTNTQYMKFKIVLSGFGVYEGKTSVIIPKDAIFDTSGNGNVETEIFVGDTAHTTIFKDSIVDFTEPTWEYVTSTINRDYDKNGIRLENGENGADGTVTFVVKGTDIYFDKDTYYTNTANRLDLTKVKVYIDRNEVSTVRKTITNVEYIEETKELATGYSRVFKGVKYTIELSEFSTYDKDVRIDIAADEIKDTSLQGNILTPIDVGNETWVEDNEPNPSNPKYKGFRNDIVDFIKPTINYQYVEGVNPKLDRTNEKVEIIFTTTDTNFLESNIGLEDMKIYIDNMQVYGAGVDSNVDITANLSAPTATTNGLQYTLTLEALELNQYILSEIFERHSGIIKIIFAAGQVADSSGNKNNETTIIIDNNNGDDEANGVIVDFVNPNIYYQDKYVNWEERYALITVRATDRYYNTSTALKTSDLTFYKQNNDGNWIDITTQFVGNVTIRKSNPLRDANNNIVGYDYTIRIDNFEEEIKMKINVKPGAKDAGGNVLNGIGDTSGNLNDTTNILVDLDNRRPTWDYVSTDTSNFQSSGIITFNIKGVDKYLDLTNSKLETANINVLKDGVDITNVNNITVTHTGDNQDEKSKSYKIDVSGLTEIATYTLVFDKNTLVDIFNNKSEATTISFSKSTIAYNETNTNTGNYTNITYHITPDMETTHSSYVHELMSVNTTGTNFENTTYRPSTIGELNNKGKNPLFAEPMYVPSVDGYTVNSLYSPKSFAGWAEADEDGNVIYYTNATLTTVSTTETEYIKLFGLYDEIPNTITNLKAVWQNAKVVFVSANNGNNSNDGKLPTTPVADLITAYSKLNSLGNATNNIIVIMDAVEWNNGNAILTGNTTITSLYAGVDYTEQGAELKISSNMIVNGSIIFDNIKLYANSTTVSNGSNYLGNGTYTNMLISNYSGDIIIGRGVTTPSDKYTFGGIVGGNFKTESKTGELGIHTIRIEAGNYNNIIAGSTLTSSTTTPKSITHNVVIGNMKDTAIGTNDKLTITGYVAIGENEQICYPSGSTATNTAANKDYANITLYSGTFTGINKFAKQTENSIIYLRSINGTTDGKINFEMYGGKLTGNIYGGARNSTVYEDQYFNTIKFYGGQVTGNIFGQSANDIFTGSATITLEGNISITGNIFGGSNITTNAENSVGKGDFVITINSSSATVNGNIYGGGKAPTDSTVFIYGSTKITLNNGTVSSIYGGGYNYSNVGISNITIENGTVGGNIFGGAYQAQVRTTSNITVLAGTIQGDIYGGNENTTQDAYNNDSYLQDVNIIIGDTDSTKSPTINGIIYGSGKYDKLDKIEIKLIEAANVTSVYGGSDDNSKYTTTTTNIELQGMTVNEIYGGGQSKGTSGEVNINLKSGTATEVYGGGFGGTVTKANIKLEGTATVTTIYGGPNTSGTVETSNIILTSGNLTNVFGGGNSASVGTSNVTLNGITIDTIHGGSKNAGLTTTSNVTLISGTVTNVFGGGLDVGVTTSNVKNQGAVVTNIYGGNNSGARSGGDTETTNIQITNSTVENVYGGNKQKGTTRYTNINIEGTSTITGNVFGGGYKSQIGKENETGSTTINIAGGIIKGDINGGSNQSVVYGNTNINIGVDATFAINSNLIAGEINIEGTIYGAGKTYTPGTITVVGNTNIIINDGISSPITYLTAKGKEKSIYGSGKGGAVYSNGTETDNSIIDIKDLGTSETPYLLKSIEDTGNLYIGNSVIELSGALEAGTESEVGHYYTLNTITNALTIYDNTTLYTQRGFNKVGGFNSNVNKNSVKASVTITDGVATTSSDNRLYSLEGVNLIFAKQEVTYNNKSTIAHENWGEVLGMTYFGTYKNTSTGKKFDLNLFKAGTYVEGQYNFGQDVSVNGFYTTVVDKTTRTEIAQIIDTTNYTNYCDWIINAPIVNYEVDLIASTYGKQSVAELILDYKYASDYNYAGGTIYTLNKVSTNALKPLTQLVDKDDPTKLPTIGTNPNNVFGLTMETTNAGWQKQALTKIYSTSNGSFAGDSVYKSDTSSTPGTIKFKIYNSVNITEEKDLGSVNIILTGQQPIGAGTEGYTFKVVIAVKLQTILDQLKEQYTPSFTDRKETELNYTTDSTVDLSYIYYKYISTTPYESGQYRVLSTTQKLPAGTIIKMKDYGQGDDLNKVYYYHVTGDENEQDGTRYLYRLSNFIDIGSIDDTYTDVENNIPYHNATKKYAFEKYDISIDFRNANIDESLPEDLDKIEQETYLELRNSDTTVKYDNGDVTIKYNLMKNQNAIPSESIVTSMKNEKGQIVRQTSFSVVEDLDILLDINASILEQNGVLDTKYYDKIAGIAIQIIDKKTNVRVRAPELQNFKLTDLSTNEVFETDANGTIRMPIIGGIGNKSGNYKLSITQANVTPGRYKAQVILYTAEDGKYYGTEPELEPLEFDITFINRLAGLMGVEAVEAEEIIEGKTIKINKEETRIISSSTGLSLVEGSETINALDLVIGIDNPTNETNIRVELYKRNPTYSDLSDETTYTGASYTLVDIKDYLQGTWETPEEYNLISATGSKEYIVSERKDYESNVKIEKIEFKNGIIQGISTGEYKLVFKAYSDNTLIQTVKKTFVVIP